MTSNPKRKLGAIYPDDAWVDIEAHALIDEFNRFMTPGVDLIAVATPIPAQDSTLKNAIVWAENGDIEEAARRLAKYDPDCFAYYCTTISFVRGPGGDEDISHRITAATGKPATTTSTAMIAAFRELDIRKVVLASPYLPDIESKFVEFIEDHDVDVLRSLSLSLPDGHAIVPPEEMSRLAESSDLPEADAVFVGCTGQRLARDLTRLEEELGKPVLTANQVTSWHAQRMLGVEPILADRGRLFA